MTLLEYYLFANLYILAFWICYRIALKNLEHFNSVRTFLNASVVLSSLLPLIQFSLAGALETGTLVTTGPELPLAGIAYSYQWSENLLAAPGPAFDWTRVFRTVLMSGSVLTALVYAYIHFRILAVIRGSTQYLRLENGLKVKLSSEVSIPFVYFHRIVIPAAVSMSDRPQVIAHETLHHRHTHHLDNLLFSLLHVLFWLNPFFLLLRRALKLNHEYQVDQQMISNGMDPVSYKLSLVRYSVGPGLFTLANGWSSSNTKHRILMINRIRRKTGKWRFFLPLPVLALLFAAFTFACVAPSTPDGRSEVPSETPPEGVNEPLTTLLQEDSLQVEIINPMAGLEGKDVVWGQKNVIGILMNRRSQVMIAGEVIPLLDIGQRIISLYNRKLEESVDVATGEYPDQTNLKVSIFVQIDRATDETDYRKLLDVISTALFKLRDMHSIRLYGKLFKELNVTEKESIATLVPLKIYGIPPKNMTGMDTPPLFQGKDKDEFLKYVAQNLRYPESAANKGISGKMVVRVVIEADGSVGDVAVIQGAYPDLDQEVIRVVKSSPRWTPATHQWKNIPASLDFPISFVLQ